MDHKTEGLNICQACTYLLPPMASFCEFCGAAVTVVAVVDRPGGAEGASAEAVARPDLPPTAEYPLAFVPHQRRAHRRPSAIPWRRRPS